MTESRKLLYREQQKLIQRQLREKIRSDPVLYEQYKEKERQRYLKRKSQNKVLPISKLSPEQRQIRRQRNRENHRAYYYRKKAQKALRENKDEPEVFLDDSIQNESPDPLSSVESGPSRNTRRSSRKAKTVASQNISIAAEESEEMCPPASLGQSDFSDDNLRNDSLLQNNDAEKFPVLVKCEREEVKEDIVEPLAHTSPIIGDPLLQSCSLPPKESTDIASGSYTVVPIINQPKQISDGNKYKLLLKRYKLKAKKEIQHLRQKIYDLKELNEKYRRQIQRLKKKGIIESEMGTITNQQNKLVGLLEMKRDQSN